jgi:hypothetical protein
MQCPTLGPKLEVIRYLTKGVIKYMKTKILLPTRIIQDNVKSHMSTRVYPKVSGLAAWSENCKW